MNSILIFTFFGINLTARLIRLLFSFLEGPLGDPKQRWLYLARCTRLVVRFVSFVTAILILWLAIAALSGPSLDILIYATIYCESTLEVIASDSNPIITNTNLDISHLLGT